MKIDLHVHTHYSKCAATRPEAIPKLAKKAGLDGIAITDHNTMKGVRKLRKTKDLIIIPGEEIRTKDGEVIGLFLNEEIPKGLDLLETVDLIREQGGVVVIPHPFDIFRRGLAWRAKKIKGYFLCEIFNARVYLPLFNLKAAELARRLGVPGVAGSDAHFPKEIGRAWTEVDDVEDLFKGRIRRVWGRWSFWDVHIRTALWKLLRQF